MKSILIKNIKQLLQVRPENQVILKGDQMNELPVLENAFLLIHNDIIEDFGPMENAPNPEQNQTVIDASGKIVLPTWVDSHTHLVYAGNRETEFVDRINGLSYEQIFNKGGGILNSAKKLQQTSEEQLYNESEKRLQQIISQGTGAVEIKSGYGLTTQSEIKILRVIKKLKENYPIAIKSTFLGAHAFPLQYKENQQQYIDLLTKEMIPLVAQENLADFVDAFLETGYFSKEQTQEVLQAGKAHGLKAKVHVNQFTSIGGIKTCVDNNALSVDHLEVLTQEDIDILKNSNTMPVALPTCSFFINIDYAPAKEMIQQGLPLAIASDFNPGTTPSGNMNFVVSTACIKLRLTPEQAINAATINAAYAMDLSKEYGSITKGKKASVIITKPLNSFYEIPYSFGTNHIDQVILKGEIQNYK
ncbi:imidazolonepropionase [Myroides sp. LJL119]